MVHLVHKQLVKNVSSKRLSARTAIQIPKKEYWKDLLKGPHYVGPVFLTNFYKVSNIKLSGLNVICYMNKATKGFSMIFSGY